MNGNAPAVALYERCADGVPARPQFHRSLWDPNIAVIVARAAARFNYAVV